MSDVSGNEASININAVVTDNATSATAIINNQLQVLAQNIASLATRAQSASNLTSSLNKALGLTASGSSRAGAEVGKYSRNIQILEQSLKNARVEADFLQKNLNAIKAANTTNPQFGQYLRQYSSHLNSAIINQKSFNKVVRGNDLRNYGQQLRSVGMAAQQSGYYFSRNFSAPIIYGLREVFYNYAKLETQNIRVTKLLADNFVGTATASNIDLAKKAVAELGIELDKITAKWGISRLLVQSLAGDYAELGIASKDMLSTMVLITAEMEKLGNLDITASQEFVSSMYQNILKSRRDLGMSVDLNNKLISDSITATLRGQMAMFNLVENKTVMSLRNIAEAFPEVSAAANLFGLSMTEAIALVTPMIAAGFQLGASANSVKVSLQRMNAMTKQNQQMVDGLSSSMDGFSYSSGVGISNIQQLVDGFNALKDNKGQQGVLEFYSRLFGVRQGPRMATSISQLAQFQDALSNLGRARAPGVQQTQENIIAKQLEQSINMQLKLKGFNTISINTIEDLSRINKMATSTIKGTDQQTALAAAVQKGQIDAQNKLKQMALKSTQNADFLGNTQTEVAKIFLAQAFDVNEMAGLMVETELLLAQKSPEVRYRQLKEGLLQIGRAIVPIVDSIVAFLVPIIQKFATFVQNLPQGVKQVLGSLLVILALTGPFKIFLGTLKTIQGMFASMKGARLLGFGKTKKEILDIKDILSRPDILKFKKVIQIPGSQAFYTEGKIPNRFDRFASRSRVPDTSGLTPETVEFLKQSKAIPGGTGGSRVLDAGGKKLVDSFVKKFEKILPGTTAFVRDLQNGINSNSENTNKVADAVKKVDKSIKDSASTAEKTAKNAASKISKTVGHIFKGPNEFIGNTFIGNAEGNQFGPGRGRPGSGPSAPFVNPAGGGGGGSPGPRYRNNVATPAGPMYGPPRDLLSAINNPNWVRLNSKRFSLFPQLPPRTFIPEAPRKTPLLGMPKPVPVPGFKMTAEELLAFNTFQQIMSIPRNAVSSVVTITKAEIIDVMQVFGHTIPAFLRNISEQRLAQKFVIPTTFKQDLFEAIKNQQRFFEVVEFMDREGQNVKRTGLKLFPDKFLKSRQNRPLIIGRSESKIPADVQRLMISMAPEELRSGLLAQANQSILTLKQRYGIDQTYDVSDEDIKKLFIEARKEAERDPEVYSRKPIERKKNKFMSSRPGADMDAETISLFDQAEELAQKAHNEAVALRKAEYDNYLEIVESQKRAFKLGRVSTIPIRKKLTSAIYRLQKLAKDPLGGYRLKDGTSAIYDTFDSITKEIEGYRNLLIQELMRLESLTEMERFDKDPRLAQKLAGRRTTLASFTKEIDQEIAEIKNSAFEKISRAKLMEESLYGIPLRDYPVFTQGPKLSSKTGKMLKGPITPVTGKALDAARKKYAIGKHLSDLQISKGKSAKARQALIEYFDFTDEQIDKEVDEYTKRLSATQKKLKSLDESKTEFSEKQRAKQAIQKPRVLSQGKRIIPAPGSLEDVKTILDVNKVGMGSLDIPQSTRIAAMTNARGKAFAAIAAGKDAITRVAIKEFTDLATLITAVSGAIPLRQIFRDPSKYISLAGSAEELAIRLQKGYKKALLLIDDSIKKILIPEADGKVYLTPAQTRGLSNLKKIRAQITQELMEVLSLEDATKLLPAVSEPITPTVKKVKVLGTKMKHRLNVLEPPTAEYNPLGRPIPADMIPGQTFAEYDNMFARARAASRKLQEDLVYSYVKSEQFLKDAFPNYDSMNVSDKMTLRQLSADQLYKSVGRARFDPLIKKFNTTIVDALAAEESRVLKEIIKQETARLASVKPPIALPAKSTALEVYRSIKMSAENAQITYTTVMQNIINGITNDTKMLGKALVIKSAATTVAKGTAIPVEIAIIKGIMQSMMSLTPGSWSNVLLQSVGDQIADIEKAMILAAQDAIDTIETGRTGSIMNRMRQLMPRGEKLTPDVQKIIDDLRLFDIVGGKSKDNFNKLITDILSKGPIASASKEVQVRIARMLIRQILFQAVAGLKDADVDKVAGLPAIQEDVVAKQVEVRAGRLRRQKNLLPGYLAPELMDRGAIDNLVQNLVDIRDSAQIAAAGGDKVDDALKTVSNSLDDAKPDLQKLANALNNLSNKQLVVPSPAAPAAPVIQAVGQVAAQSSIAAINPVVNALDAMTSDLNEIAKTLKALPVSAIKGKGTTAIKKSIADNSVPALISKARTDIERAAGMSAKSAAKTAGQLAKSTQLLNTVQQALNTAVDKTTEVVQEVTSQPGEVLQTLTDDPVTKVTDQIGEAAKPLEDAAENIKENMNIATKGFTKNISDAADALEVQIDTAFANVFTGPNLFKGPNQFIGNSFLDGDKIKNIKFVDNLDRTRNIRATRRVDTSQFQYEDDVFKPFGLLESAEMKQRAVRATKVRNIKPYVSKIPLGKNFFDQFSKAYESGRAMQFLGKKIASVGSGENLKKVASGLTSIAKASAILPTAAVSTFFSSLLNSKLLTPFLFMFTAGISTLGLRATRAAQKLGLFNREIYRTAAAQTVLQKVNKAAARAGEQITAQEAAARAKSLSRGQKFVMGAPTVFKTGTANVLKSVGTAVGAVAANFVKLFMVLTILAPVVVIIGAIFATFKTMGQGSSVAINYLKEAFNNLRQAIANLANPIFDVIQSFGGFSNTKLQSQAEKSAGAFATLAYFIKKVSESFKKFTETVGKSFMTNTFAPFLTRIINKFIMLKRAIVATFTGETETAIKYFKGFLFSLGYDVVGIIGLALRGIGKLFQSASGVIGSFFGYVTDKFIGFTLYILEGLRSIAIAATAAFGIIGGLVTAFGGPLGAPLLGLAGAAGVASVAIIGLEQTLKKNRASIVGGAAKIGTAFSNKVGETFVKVGNKAEGVQSKIATAYQKIMGVSLNIPLIKIFKNPNAIADEIREAFKKAAPAALDGGAGLINKINQAVKNGLLDLQVEFTEKLFSNLDEQFDKVTNNIKKQLDKQRENALDAFDDMSAGIDALAEAEEKLTKKMDYEEKRREMIRNRASDVENYIRERKLAIYEGRYEDARRLDAEERKAKQSADKELLDLDRGYNRDLQAEQREIAKAVIANQKEQLEKQFDLLEEQFDEQVELLKEKGFASKEEFEKSLKNLGGIGVDFSEKMATIFGSSMDELPSAISKSIDSAIKLFDTDLSTLVDIAAQKFGATANVKDPKSILGAAYHMANGVTDAFKSAFNASVIPQYVTPTMDAIKTLLTTTTTSEAITTMWDQAGIRAVNAMINGIKRTIAGLKGDLFSEFKTKFESLIKELQDLATIKITLETIREEEKGAGAGAKSESTPGFQFEDPSAPKSRPEKPSYAFGSADNMERQIEEFNERLRSRLSGSVDNMERQMNTAIDESFDAKKIEDKIVKIAVPALSRVFKEIMIKIGTSMGSFIKDNLLMVLTIAIIGPLNLLAATALGRMMTAAWEKIKTFWTEQLLPWLGGLKDQIGEKVKDAWRGLSTGLSNTWGNITNWFTVTVPENVGGFVKKIGEKLSGAWDGLFTGLKDVWNDIKSWFGKNVTNNPVFSTIRGITGRIGGIFQFSAGGLVPVKGYAKGGYTGGSPNTAIPAILHGGEFVLNAKAVERIGVGALTKMNDNRIPYFKKGGPVGKVPTGSALRGKSADMMERAILGKTNAPLPKVYPASPMTFAELSKTDKKSSLDYDKAAKQGKPVGRSVMDIFSTDTKKITGGIKELGSVFKWGLVDAGNSVIKLGNEINNIVGSVTDAAMSPFTKKSSNPITNYIARQDAQTGKPLNIGAMFGKNIPLQNREGVAPGSKFGFVDAFNVATTVIPIKIPGLSKIGNFASAAISEKMGIGGVISLKDAISPLIKQGARNFVQHIGLNSLDAANPTLTERIKHVLTRDTIFADGLKGVPRRWYQSNFENPRPMIALDRNNAPEFIKALPYNYAPGADDVATGRIDRNVLDLFDELDFISGFKTQINRNQQIYVARLAAKAKLQADGIMPKFLSSPEDMIYWNNYIDDLLGLKTGEKSRAQHAAEGDVLFGSIMENFADALSGRKKDFFTDPRIIPQSKEVSKFETAMDLLSRKIAEYLGKIHNSPKGERVGNYKDWVNSIGKALGLRPHMRHVQQLPYLNLSKAEQSLSKLAQNQNTWKFSIKDKIKSILPKRSSKSIWDEFDNDVKSFIPKIFSKLFSKATKVKGKVGLGSIQKIAQNAKETAILRLAGIKNLTNFRSSPAIEKGPEIIMTAVKGEVKDQADKSIAMSLGPVADYLGATTPEEIVAIARTRGYGISREQAEKAIVGRFDTPYYTLSSGEKIAFNPPEIGDLFPGITNIPKAPSAISGFDMATKAGKDAADQYLYATIGANRHLPILRYSEISNALAGLNNPFTNQVSDFQYIKAPHQLLDSISMARPDLPKYTTIADALFYQMYHGNLLQRFIAGRQINNFAKSGKSIIDDAMAVNKFHLAEAMRTYPRSIIKYMSPDGIAGVGFINKRELSSSLLDNIHNWDGVSGLDATNYAVNPMGTRNTKDLINFYESKPVSELMEQVLLVHETSFKPIMDNLGNVTIKPTGFYDPNINRQTVHFAVNHRAGGHIAREGLDEGTGYVVISTLNNAVSANPGTLHTLGAVDTYFSAGMGGLKLPASGVRVVKNTPEDIAAAMNELAPGKNFRPQRFESSMMGTTYGDSVTESYLQYIHHRLGVPFTGTGHQGKLVSTLSRNSWMENFFAYITEEGGNPFKVLELMRDKSIDLKEQYITELMVGSAFKGDELVPGVRQGIFQRTVFDGPAANYADALFKYVGDIEKGLFFPSYLLNNKQAINDLIGALIAMERGKFGRFGGGDIPKFKKGGFVPGAPSMPIPATLHGGEFVLNAEAVRKIGIPALSQLNKAKFSVPEIPSMRIPSPSLQAVSGASSSTQNVNIYVDTFVGEPEWFKSMMKEYNTKILPRNQKAAGLENRVISTYNGLNRGN